MKIEQNYSLLAHNSFGFQIQCQQYAAPQTHNQLLNLLKEIKSDSNYLVLGGGSNILFLDHYPGLIIHPQMSFIDCIEEDADHVYLSVGAGVHWDSLVQYTVDRQWHGLENLSAIPGNVGAAPVQNIGAYGAEAKDTIWKVEGIFIDTRTSFSFTNAACQFDYRNSIFKTSLKNKTVISSVTFRLSKKPQLNSSYGTIQAELSSIKDPNIQDIRSVICKIRSEKLPDPKVIGNAGSFFKNPIVDTDTAQNLKEKYPTLPIYPGSSGTKLAAGWLIEQCGFKGIHYKHVGVHSKQALVLVHYGGGKATEISELAQMIITKVNSQFGIELEPEVNFIGLNHSK